MSKEALKKKCCPSEASSISFSFFNGIFRQFYVAVIFLHPFLIKQKRMNGGPGGNAP